MQSQRRTRQILAITYVLAAMMVTGCVTEQEARKHMVFKAEGDNSVPAVADCITRQFKSTSDMFLTRDLTEDGISLKVMARVQFGMSAIQVIDIYRRDGTTFLEAHRSIKGTGNTENFAGYAECLRLPVP